ncbi:MAG: hypothetical protein NT124_01670 [Candidatus Dependentiae bacterium]|nr:hypothetical protein [Candidatus Dependentiae bacterium]
MHKHLYLFVCLFLYSFFLQSAQENRVPITKKSPHYFTFSPEHIALSQKNAAKKKSTKIRAQKKRLNLHKITTQPLPPKQTDLNTLFLNHQFPTELFLDVDYANLADQHSLAPFNSPNMQPEKNNYCLLAKKIITIIINYYPE